MPIIKINGFKYGKHGKVYKGRGARAKARKQGQAIEISKLRRKGYKILIKGTKKRRGTIRRIK